MYLNLLCRFAVPIYRGWELWKTVSSYHNYEKRKISTHSESVKNILIRSFNINRKFSLSQLTNFEKSPFCKKTSPNIAPSSKTIEELVAQRFKVVDAKEHEKPIAFQHLVNTNSLVVTAKEEGKYYVIAIDPKMDDLTREKLVILVASSILNHDGLTRPLKTFTYSTVAALSGVIFGTPLAASFLLTLAIDQIADIGTAQKEAMLGDNLLANYANNHGT